MRPSDLSIKETGATDLSEIQGLLEFSPKLIAPDFTTQIYFNVKERE